MTRHDDTTPTRKSGIAATKKNSDTKNKAWKNRIREACLNRVRRQRQDQPDDRTMMMTTTQTVANDGSYVDSRLLVEAELKLHGVRVVSPPNKSNWNYPLPQNLQQSTVPMMMDCGGEEEALPSNNDDDVLVMTEDEVFDLMEEIEREWKQQNEKLLEEEMDRIENEQQALYATIADYERDEAVINDGDAVVLCPLCQEANLTTSQCTEIGDDIVCPNQMDESCSLRLEARSGLDLSSLRERLAQTISSHAEICNCTITFQMSHEYTSEDCHLALLWGTCSVCGTRSCVA